MPLVCHSIQLGTQLDKFISTTDDLVSVHDHKPAVVMVTMMKQYVPTLFPATLSEQLQGIPFITNLAISWFRISKQDNYCGLHLYRYVVYFIWCAV